MSVAKDGGASTVKTYESEVVIGRLGVGPTVTKCAMYCLSNQSSTVYLELHL